MLETISASGDTRASQNIYLGFLMIGRQMICAHMVDDSLDVLRVAQAGNEDVVSARLKISFAALKGIAHGFSGLDTGLPVGIRAGIDDEVNSRGLGGASGGLDARNLLW